MSIVRNNLMNDPNYTPYCGRDSKCGGMWPRTSFNGKQFVCKACGWESSFDDEFIKEYKEKWTNASSDLVDIKELQKVDVVQIIRNAKTLNEAVVAMNGLAANGHLTLWSNATHPDGTSYRDLIKD